MYLSFLQIRAFIGNRIKHCPAHGLKDTGILIWPFFFSLMGEGVCKQNYWRFSHVPTGTKKPFCMAIH